MNNSSWPEPYMRLAEALYRLRRDFGSETLLGASLVHPRHPIPAEHHALLKALASNAKLLSPSWSALARRRIICFLSALCDSLTLLVIRLSFSLPDSKFDVVIKTWVLNKESFWKDSDFYMGALSPGFTANGKRPLLLAGDGRPDDGRLTSKLKSLFLLWGFVKETLKTKNPRYLPEVLLVPFWFPLAACAKQILLSGRLRRYAEKNMGDAVLSAAAGQAALDILRPYTTKNLSHAAIGKGLVKRWSPRMVITLYEGQPWEKVFWGAVKAASPDVRLVGYQHTVIMPHSLALVAPVAIPQEVPVPDTILCTGLEARKAMVPGHAKFPSEFLVYGSHRRAVSKGGEWPPRPAAKKILVLPEGNMTESRIVFDKAIDMAEAMPDHTFVFRCHPLLPFEKVQPYLKSPIQRLPNIEVSRRPTIEPDFAEASCLFYRGSSAAFYAVLSGVKPFCYWIPETPNIDPLWFVNGWREYGGSTQDLVSKIFDYAQTDPAAARQQWKPAADSLNIFTQPADPSVVAELAKSFI